MKITWKWLGIIIVILITAGALKIWLVFANLVPFNADEAIIALMARHILAGERPTFFYGQVYMGSLDAFLVAVGFLIWGQQVWVIRLLQGILYLATIITTVWIGSAGFGSLKTGAFGACLLAIPTVNITLYTTASLGGYGEALFIGNLIILTGIYQVQRIKNQDLGARQLIPLLGFLSGLGLWANAITLVFSIPVALVILLTIYHNKISIGAKKLVLMGCSFTFGFLIGSSPWWIFAINNGWSSLFRELFGSAVSVETGGYFEKILSHLLNLVLLGSTVVFGLRPPWEVRWLAVPLLPLILAFWLGALFFLVKSMFRSNSNRFMYGILGGVGIAFTGGFLFTSFGVDPSGRYFLPMSVPLALVAAELVQALWRKIFWQIAAIGIIVISNSWGLIQCALDPIGFTTQFYPPSIIDHRFDDDLINFLEQEGERYGYSNYWVSYPLAFLSQERLIYVPRLPYHPDLRYTTRDDRYPQYNQIVSSSPRVAYITTRNPELNTWLRQKFYENRVTWSEKIIGDYQIYYHLSKPVRPEQIGLGENH